MIMIRKSLTAILSLVLAIAATVQLSAATKEQLQMMADIRMLQLQSQELQNLIASLTGALTEALKAVSTRLDQQTDATRKAFADQKLVVDAISKDLSVVREKVDDSNVRIGSLAQEVDALRQSVVLLSAPPPAAAESTVPPDPSSPDSAAPAPSPVSQPAAAAAAAAIVSSPQRMWNSAFADYTAGDYDLAVLGFEAYARTFPKSDMADDAQVHICTAYSNEGKYDKALEACDQAIRTYPTGSAIPEAFYRKGTALQRLQRPDAARDAFEHLLKTYPESPEATLAQQRLEGLKQPQP